MGEAYGCGAGLQEQGRLVEPGLRGREVGHFGGEVVRFNC